LSDALANRPAMAQLSADKSALCSGERLDDVSEFQC
jgi:hypothetical protein